MSTIDLIIIALYFGVLLIVGWYFSGSNHTDDDYFLGGRNIKSWHVGLSVVATDVGGGFSIGLGGLGFTIGLSGSWMLFTGLIGAWLSAVLLIPKVKKLESMMRFQTFNDLIHYLYGSKAAKVATIISLIGYVGFTSSQFLAGAKLTSAIVPDISISHALWITGTIAVLYTTMGGLKAVIYTDTVQWIILIVGLVFVGIPVSYHFVGGYHGLVSSVPSHFFSLNQVSAKQMMSWALTIIPVWFIGLTLYQRIYACKNVQDAKKAWYLAGLLEWPIMAFMGVTLGLLARAGYEQNLFSSVGFASDVFLDSEMGLPVLLKAAMPTVFLGLILAAYFSAILSTADSCLMASSGSLVSDILQKKYKKLPIMKLAKWTTGLLGFLAIVLASYFTDVLDLMLMSYEVMVSALFVPVLWGFYSKKTDRRNTYGFFAILVGGATNLTLNMVSAGGLNILYGLLASCSCLLLTLLPSKSKVL